jgi:hypothetical protein
MKLLILAERMAHLGITEDAQAEAAMHSAIESHLGVRHEFKFEGGDHTGCSDCKTAEPHAPHATSTYQTVRYGTLEHYCLGKEGAGMTIVIIKKTAGCAEYPGYARGYYITEKK